MLNERAVTMGQNPQGIQKVNKRSSKVVALLCDYFATT
jgi:hypothetical protein